MEIGTLAAAVGALIAALVAILRLKPERQVSAANVADQLTEAAERLIAPLNGRIAALTEEVAECMADRMALREEVSRLTGQVEVLRTTAAQSTAGAVDSALGAMLAAAPDGIVLVNKYGVMEYANRTAETMFGYSVGRLVGMPVDDLVPERFRKAHKVHQDLFMVRPEARPMGMGRELWGRRFDGTEFPIEIGLAPMRRVGEDEKVIAIVRDMTKRRNGGLPS